MITFLWGAMIGAMFAAFVASCASHGDSTRYTEHQYAQWAVVVSLLVLALMLTLFTNGVYEGDANWIPLTPTPILGR